MDKSFQENLDYYFVGNVNKRENVGYSRAQSHINYFMNPEFVQHEDKCDIYEKSHTNSVPMALYSDVVDIESELINRTRKLSKCSTRQSRPDSICMTCNHAQKCTTKQYKNNNNPKCTTNIVRHKHDEHKELLTKYFPFKM